jgi:hypothetical protein
MNLHPPVDESRYSLLSEAGVHLVPGVSPQTFNEHGRPTLGAKFQYAGLICTLNELAVAVAEAGACVSAFAYVGNRQEPLRNAAQVLLNAVGNLDLELTREAQAGA